MRSDAADPETAAGEVEPPKVTISRLFDNVEDAQRAVLRLEAAGVDPDEISLVANNSEKWFAPDFAAAAGKGAALGAGFGGVGGLLAGLGLLAIPGLGPVVAVGWLAAAAAGAVAAGAAGGVLGVMAEAGIATNEAEVYAESIRRGGSLVAARVDAADKDRLQSELDPSSVNVEQRRNHLTSSGWTRFDPSAPDLTEQEMARERAQRGRSG
jgi:hypothetical protein